MSVQKGHPVWFHSRIRSYREDDDERTDDELLDSELFHGVGWGRLLLGLSDGSVLQERKAFGWKKLAMVVVVLALSCRCPEYVGTGPLLVSALGECG